jgi:hypothetical protein
MSDRFHEQNFFFLLPSKMANESANIRETGRMIHHFQQWQPKQINGAVYVSTRMHTAKQSESHPAYHFKLMGSSLFLPLTQWSSLAVFAALP